MAEALIRVYDTKDGKIEVEAKFTGEVNNQSPAHQFVAKFIENAGLQKVEDAEKPAKVQ